MKRQTYIILLCISFLIIFIFPARGINRDELFQQDKDNIYFLISESREANNSGDFKKGEEYIESAVVYYDELKNKYTGNRYDYGTLEYELLYAQAWNKTLLKNYAVAEALYADLIEIIPDTLHLQRSNAYTGLSSLYGMHQQYDLSEVYALKALEEAKLGNSDEASFHAESNLGDIYMETGNYERALEKYLEVRKLSVVLSKNEAISLGNLAVAYYKLGRLGLANEYFEECLELSKDDAPVVYSIILPMYCEMLIEMGETAKARELVLEAVNDSRYTQRADYNLQYLSLLTRLYPKENKLLPLSIGLGMILLIGVIIFQIAYRRKKIALDYSLKENIQLKKRLNQYENGEILLSNSQSQENTLKLIGFFESFPRIYSLINKIKLKPDQKSEVSSSAKELVMLMAPFTSDTMEKEIGFYLEQGNQDFYDKLKEDYPKLTLTDLRLCTLIKIGMNTKEIAVLTNKSVRGIESAKFRLRKKMNIEGTMDIYDRLMEIEKSE